MIKKTPEEVLSSPGNMESEVMPHGVPGPDSPEHITEPAVMAGLPISDVERELIKEAALLDMKAADIEAIRDKAKARAIAKQKEQVEKRLEDMYYQQEMAKVDPDEEMVEYVPDFPSSNLIHNRVPICGALVNNQPFENGKPVKIPKSKYRDLAYISFMAHKNERGLNLRNRDGIPELKINLPRQL